jgi:hypothetical protein
MSKCNACGEKIKQGGIDCDWRQGRCPHRYPYLTDYHFRFYDLIQTIKGWFK